ncbi:MAG: hypothetical protein KatS3mg110_0755 [Pirellulaceae bacterium]|nr:MAG: hypothetical protein KatS3mg110_0755 [Pirellulaceae bacterium]
MLAGCLVAAVVFANLGATRLWDRDEPRNAGCAWEMLERGDWIVPTFNGELRSHKPVLLYWLMMSAYRVFGRTEWAARFWSAVLSVGSCLLLADLVRRWLGSSVAVLAAVVLGTSLMFVVAARAATPDAALIFFVTAALWWFARHHVVGSRGDRENRAICGVSTGTRFLQPWNIPFASGYYALLGLAVLAKGPVGAILPAAITGVFLWWDHFSVESATVRDGCLRRTLRSLLSAAATMRLGPGIVILLAVAAPWYVWVSLRTEGQFLYEFLFVHNWQRARTAFEGHAGPFFYYLPAFLVGFFPWSIFFVPTVLEVWYHRRDKEHRRIISFFICWFVVWVGAFSCAQTKLPSYITPAYPAAAALTAFYLDQWQKYSAHTRPAWVFWALVVLGIAGTGILAGAWIVVPKYLPDERLLALIGLVPVAGAAAGMGAWLANRRQQVVAIVAASAMLLCLGLFAWAAVRVDRYRNLEKLVAHLSHSGTAAECAALGVLEPSWVFYLGRPIKCYGVTSDESVSEQVASFLGESGSRRLVTTATLYQRLDKELSGRVQIVGEVPYFLENETLVILSGVPSTARAEQPARIHSR